MWWFLRSVVAVAGLGSAAPVVLAQPDAPAPMMPPVRALPDPEPPPPASGFLSGLKVPPPAPEPANPMAAPVPPVMPVAAFVPDVSAAKPAPPETEQTGMPANPAAERPDRLPPLQPEAPGKPPVKAPAKAAGPALPAPPSTGPLPPVPLAPALAPLAPAPRAAAKPAPAAKPGAPAFFPPGTAPVKAGPSTYLPPATAKLAGTKTYPPVVPRAKMAAASACAAGSAAALCAPSASCPTARLADAVCDPVWRLLPQDAPVRVRGWLDGGYVYNTSNPDSKFNGPYNSVDRSAEPMLNQAYLILDRPLPAGGAIGAGFRVDALFGTDHFLGQSRGFEVDRDFNQRWNGQYYGLAIPQAYAELGNDVMALKVGHFYSPVGYESLAAAGNFFYSHAYSYQFGQPFTHWGGLLSTQLTRNWQVQAGLVNGWDALVGRANNVNFVGGAKFTADSGRWWSSFALVTGQEQNNVAGLPDVAGTDGNRTRYSFLIGLLPGGPCGRWEYVFHHHYGWQEHGTPQDHFARWYGIDQYLYYRVSKSVKLGTRVEWFRDEDGTRVGLNRPSNPNNPPLPGNYFALTGGLNYTPTANLVVRPEIRWDFTSDTARPAFNDGRKSNQLMLGCDVIWQF